MKNFRFALAAVLAASFFAFTGCTSGTKPGGLSEQLVAVYATDASLAQKQVTITMRYANENVSALGFSGATHKVFLNGNYVGKVLNPQPFGIPPVQSITQDAIVELEKPDVVKDLLARGQVSSVSYHLESLVTQTIYEDNFSYHLAAEGSAELHRGAPPATAK